MAEEKKEAPPKRNVKQLAVFAAIGIFLIGGGVAGGMFMMSRGETVEAEPKEESTSDEIAGDAKGKHGEEGGEGADSTDSPPVTTYQFEKPFVVNLLDPEGHWFLQVLIQIETTSPEGVDRIEKNIAPLRDTVIMLLSSKTREEISKIEGKMRLKTEIIRRLDAILGAGTVKQIYFAEFSTHYN